MVFTVGHSAKSYGIIANTDTATAQEALNTVEALQASDEVVRFVKHGGYEIALGELRVLVEQENSEKEARRTSI